MVLEQGRGHLLLVSPEKVSYEVFSYYHSYLIEDSYPIEFTLKVPFKQSYFGCIYISLRQDCKGGNVEIWTSVKGPLFKNEGANYYLFRKKEHRALIVPKNCSGDEHIQTWFIGAVDRVYKNRCRDFMEVLAIYSDEFYETVQEWVMESLDVLYNENW